jgi:hypothetical protein
MKVRGTRTGRWLLLTGVGLLGLLVGVGLGGASVPAKTTTSTISTTVHETATVTTQKIVRKPPVTITRTETKSVLKGGDNAFDYGSYQGEFEVRGLRGDNTDLGGRILGQIRSPSRDATATSTRARRASVSCDSLLSLWLRAQQLVSTIAPSL